MTLPQALEQSQAYQEMQRIKSMSAFNVNKGQRIKINQYATAYNFNDGSTLWINHYKSMASASIKGSVSMTSINTNARGN